LSVTHVPGPYQGERGIKEGSFGKCERAGSANPEAGNACSITHKGCEKFLRAFGKSPWEDH
jgi:hypothetical protein